MNGETLGLDRYVQKLDSINTIKTVGIVKRAVGLIVESQGPPVSVGEFCEISGPDSSFPIPAEVVGFRDNYVLSMPLFKVDGVKLGFDFGCLSIGVLGRGLENFINRVAEHIGQNPGIPLGLGELGFESQERAEVVGELGGLVVGLKEHGPQSAYGHILIGQVEKQMAELGNGSGHF